MEKWPAEQANVAVLKAPRRKKKTITTDEYQGDEPEFYYPAAESMNVNNTFKENSQVCKWGKQLQHSREENEQSVE